MYFFIKHTEPSVSNSPLIKEARIFVSFTFIVFIKAMLFFLPAGIPRTLFFVEVIMFKALHLGCSLSCQNQWCRKGQYNLILKQIDEIRSTITDKFNGVLGIPGTDLGRGGLNG